MAEFSELIKNFDKIRSYMRDFYVYGFRCREEFLIKSARSYDNERRRIESYLKDYIEFKQNKSGKSVFLTIDGANVLENPLCRAFKTKTFTKNDITLHFIILDIMQTGVKLTTAEVCETVAREYLSFFESPLEMDLATVRNKLNEYVKLVMLCVEKDKGKLFYFVPKERIEIESLFDAISFFSISHPLGIVGSFLLDRFDRINDIFTSKHKYLLDVLDSEIITRNNKSN